MSFLPAVFAVVGGVVSGIGALEQGQAAAAADKYNAQVEKQNENVALSEGVAEAADQKRKNEMQLGRIQAAYGAAGIDMGGDALGVYQDSASQAAYSIAKIHYDAKLRETGYADQAQLDESKAHSDSTAGVLNMFSDVVGGFATGFKDAGSSLLKAA